MSLDTNAPIRTKENTVSGFRVLYEELHSNWTAFTPDLPIILVTGSSYEEVVQLMREAIPAHIEELRKDREERPWLYRPESLSPALRDIFAQIDAA